MNQAENMWTENIILADADYVDSVAFNLIVNFERMIGRRIPPADMSRWAECIALDGGLRNGEHQTTVVLLHDKEKTAMTNFVPSDYATELNAQAFKSHLGEFLFSSISSEGMATKEDFFLDTLLTIGSQKEVKRLMVIPDEQIYNEVRETVKRIDDTDDSKRITVFAMQPMPGGPFRQEILGYSLMAAMGIRGEEVKCEEGEG